MITTKGPLKKEGIVPIQNTANTDSNDDSIEVLRRILTKRQHRPIAHSEATEIGDALIEFYQVLAEEAQDDSAS